MMGFPQGMPIQMPPNPAQYAAAANHIRPPAPQPAGTTAHFVD